MNPRMIEDMGNSMGEVYEAVTNQILINLAKHFQYIKDGTEPAGAWQYQVKKLAEMGQVTKETEQIILSMLGEADEALQGVLEAAIRDGLKDVEPALKQAAERGLLGVQGPVAELSPNQTQAFQAYYKQSADKLNLVNTTMLKSTQQAYKSTVADIVTKLGKTQTILNTATGEVVTGVTSFNAAVRSAVKKMVDNGLTGFVYYRGDGTEVHVSPEAYVTMDVRTTAAQTSRRAVYDRMADYASDLYQVSYHDGARPLCYPWQGKVISRDDWSRDVTDGDGNTVHVYAQSETSYGEAAGLFGINCGHYPIPFIPGFSSIRPPKQDAEENAKEYAESQKQRELERKLRNEKRDLAVLKAQGADQAEIDAQKAKVNQARDNLDDFCTETGRARRKSREYVPIKPEWPDTGNGSGTVGGNVASQATPEPATPVTIKGHTEKLRSTMQPDEYEEFVKMVDGSETAKLYERYGDSCARIDRMQTDRKSYYNPGADNVVYGFTDRPGMSKYSTMSHEMAHMFDSKIGRDAGLTFNEIDVINSKCVIGSGAYKAVREVPSASDQFLKAMRKDKESLKELLKNADEIAKMKSGTLRNASAGVQDAMDGFFDTQDRYILPWGHGSKYYNGMYNRRIKALKLEGSLKSAYNELGFGFTNQAAAKKQFRDYETAIELWANVMSAITCGGEELDAFKQYMPETVDAAMTILRGL